MRLPEFIRQSYVRFTAPTPAFWKSVQRKFVRLGAMFVALGGVYQAAPAGFLPEIILTVITYAGIVCGAVVVVAQFACDDTKPEDGVQ